jgi:hypothetical protein
VHLLTGYLCFWRQKKKNEKKPKILRRSLSLCFVYIFRRNKSGPHGGVLQRWWRWRRQRFTQLSRLRIYRRERRRKRRLKKYTQPRPTSVSVYKCVAWNATLYLSQHIFWLLCFVFVFSNLSGKLKRESSSRAPAQFETSFQFLFCLERVKTKT